MPACGGSTSAWTRWTRTGSSRLTRRPGFEQVIEGILAAKEAGFDPVKINAVAMRGGTEEDIVPLARFAREHALELRFIEYMPLDGGVWEREKVLFAAEILDRLTTGDRPPGAGRGPGSARSGRRLRLCRWRRQGRPHRLGQPPFLHELQPHSPDLRRQAPQLPLRPRRDRHPGPASRAASDDEIAAAVRQSVADKWEGHEINTARFIQPERLMHSIGG